MALDRPVVMQHITDIRAVLNEMKKKRNKGVRDNSSVSF